MTKCYAGTTIRLSINDVMDGWSDTTGINVRATNAAYCARMEELLQAAYPGADVEVSSQPNVTGPDGILIHAPDLATHEDIQTTISDISDTLMNDSESWVVMVSPPVVTYEYWTHKSSGTSIGVKLVDGEPVACTEALYYKDRTAENLPNFDYDTDWDMDADEWKPEAPYDPAMDS